MSNLRWFYNLCLKKFQKGKQKLKQGLSANGSVIIVLKNQMLPIRWDERLDIKNGMEQTCESWFIPETIFFFFKCNARNDFL